MQRFTRLRGIHVYLARERMGTSIAVNGLIGEGSKIRKPERRPSIYGACRVARGRCAARRGFRSVQGNRVRPAPIGRTGRLVCVGFAAQKGLEPGVGCLWLAVQRAYCCRSEEHTPELQSLMRLSYAVFCLQKKNTGNHT